MGFVQGIFRTAVVLASGAGLVSDLGEFESPSKTSLARIREADVWVLGGYFFSGYVPDYFLSLRVQLWWRSRGQIK